MLSSTPPSLRSFSPLEADFLLQSGLFLVSQIRQVCFSPSHQHSTPSGFSTSPRSCHHPNSSSSCPFISLRSSSSSSPPPLPPSAGTSTLTTTPLTNIPLNGVILYEGSFVPPFQALAFALPLGSIELTPSRSSPFVPSPEHQHRTSSSTNPEATTPVPAVLSPTKTSPSSSGRASI